MPIIWDSCIPDAIGGRAKILYSIPMSDQILYEHPLNERIRVFLRLEHLFNQISHFRNGSSVWDIHACVSALIEIITILERTDIRSEMLKELDRHIHELSALLESQQVDRQRLQSTLQELSAQATHIQGLPTKLRPELRDNELLTSVRQRTVISGGTCGFDIPAYHYWLNQGAHLKASCVAQWLEALLPFDQGIDLILTLIRNSTFFEEATAHAGFFQRSLDSQYPCQLLRIHLEAASGIYPEVSGNKHRINLRFMEYNPLGRATQITDDLRFELSCCAI